MAPNSLFCWALLFLRLSPLPDSAFRVCLPVKLSCQTLSLIHIHTGRVLLKARGDLGVMGQGLWDHLLAFPSAWEQAEQGRQWTQPLSSLMTSRPCCTSAPASGRSRKVLNKWNLPSFIHSITGDSVFVFVLFFLNERMDSPLLSPIFSLQPNGILYFFPRKCKSLKFLAFSNDVCSSLSVGKKVVHQILTEILAFSPGNSIWDKWC